MTSVCEYSSVDDLGPLQIDYIYLYSCIFQSSSFFILILFLWIFYLTSLLGNTASNYFSPTLGSICVKLNLSYSLAGVTFLAFGNGSPDVFSSFASVAGNADVSVGLGALLGGSVFISCVVVGGIAMLCPSAISRVFFVRDISFHFVAVFLVAIVAAVQDVNIYLAFSFVFVYFIYCCIVVVSTKYFSEKSSEENAEKNNKNKSQIQTAFWHKSENKNKVNKNIAKEVSPLKTDNNKSASNSNDFMKNNISPSLSDENSSEEYKFLILDEVGKEKSDDKNKETSGSKENREKENILKENDDEEETIINLSGGLISSEFNAEIFDDYVGEKLKEDSYNVYNPIPEVSMTNNNKNSLFNNNYEDLKSASRNDSKINSKNKNKIESFDVISAPNKEDKEDLGFGYFDNPNKFPKKQSSFFSTSFTSFLFPSGTSYMELPSVDKNTISSNNNNNLTENLLDFDGNDNEDNVSENEFGLIEDSDDSDSDEFEDEETMGVTSYHSLGKDKNKGERRNQKQKQNVLSKERREIRRGIRENSVSAREERVVLPGEGSESVSALLHINRPDLRLSRHNQNKNSISNVNGYSSLNQSSANNSFSSVPTGRSQLHSSVRALYWQQLLVRRRLQKSLSSHFTLFSETEFCRDFTQISQCSDWNALSFSRKLIFVFVFLPTVFLLSLFSVPATILRDFTIPTVDPLLWSKPAASLQPVLCSLFITFILGGSYSYVGALPLPAFVFIISLPVSLAVFLSTHYSYPPRSNLFASVLVLVAFVMCIFWVYVLAGELVGSLSAMGKIMKVPAAYLGLTFLAWGNCMGDFFSNISLSKKGFGEMALAGCYAAPVFNILFGLGFSFIFVCVKQFPVTYHIELDTASKISLLFTLISLTSTVISVGYNNFKYERSLGYFLIALYVIYLLVQLSLLVSGIN